MFKFRKYETQTSFSGYKVESRTPGEKGVRTVVDGFRSMKLAGYVAGALGQAQADFAADNGMVKDGEMQPVGYWVVTSAHGEFTKWGKDGDTEFPLQSYDVAKLDAKFLADQPEYKDAKFYILVVFPNGQMRTDEVL